jgi:hypothetical protein
LVISGGAWRYVPTRAILESFETVKKILKLEGPDALRVFLPMLSKYELHVVETCKNTEKLSRTLQNGSTDTCSVKIGTERKALTES